MCTLTGTLIIKIDEEFNDIPDSEKNGLYYFVTTTFVISTLLSTLFSAAFLASSVVFLIAQSVKTSNVNAFLIKRFVNTMEIIAGAAIPSFFFFTSKEIRRLLSSRVSASSSQGGPNNQIRGMRYIS
ncbi:hypothetical protein L5515_006000 [Caenorhabditis briggsae]|uniref:Uncharacterized protein n=1 Tax=Caenorhabditis briggsae TaxID=6238 RepID=A0AAE9EZG6_CAEBR|nr:hypothetical protein L5515_006000 [Caenorhabditis briggsae]